MVIWWMLPTSTLGSPLDHIDIAGTPLKYEFSEAQTFGSNIYFKEQPSDVSIKTMKHEMMHVKQWDRNGRDLGLMGEKYMRGFCDAGYSTTGVL